MSAQQVVALSAPLSEHSRRPPALPPTLSGRGAKSFREARAGFVLILSLRENCCVPQSVVRAVAAYPRFCSRGSLVGAVVTLSRLRGSVGDSEGSVQTDVALLRRERVRHAEGGAAAAVLRAVMLGRERGAGGTSILSTVRIVR